MGNEIVNTAGEHRVTFARLSRRGVVVGLDLAQLIVLGVGLVVAIPSVYVGGVSALAVTSPIWGAAAVAAFARIGGRTVIAWAPVALHHLLRVVTRQTTYRATAVDQPTKEGRLALPGDAAALRHYTDATSGAVMVHDPHTRTLTAGLRVRHTAFMLADPAEQDRRARAWGNALAGFCTGTPIISRIQTLERTLPESGVSADAYWRDHGVDDAGWAAESYRQLMDTSAPESERHESLISLSLDMRAASRQIREAGGGVPGAAVVLAEQLGLFASRMPSLDLRHDGWLTPDDLATILRGAYDPASHNALARHQVGRQLGTAGPLAITEEWGCFQADSAWHCVLWVAEWPRVQVPVDFLWPLLLTSGVRRTVSISYQPVAHHKAMRSVRHELLEHESDVRQRAKSDTLTTEAQRREHSDVARRERELVAGAGDMRYVGLVTVSAPDKAALQAAVQKVTIAAAEAHCELRVLYGQQTQAFTAGALPLGRGLR